MVGNNDNTSQNGQLSMQAMGELTTRLMMARKLGMSFGGKRDLYKALGYPEEIDSKDMMKRWSRQGIAQAIVNRPANDTWKGDVTITEPDTKEETKLESAYKELDERLSLKSRFLRLDKLAQLGEYAVLLLGFDDSAAETWAQPVSPGDRSLKYVRPVSRENIEIDATEADAANERYGLPRIYRITLDASKADKGNTEKSKELKVHYSRVIHVAYNLLEDEIVGNPVMKGVYNRLMDLEKLVGGSAEMFWRGARPGYAGEAKEDYKIGDKAKERFKEQIEEYEHDLRRVLVSEGIELKSLAQQISDPEGSVKVQLQMISAATGLPMRQLVGSERGELASSQDQKNWAKFISGRRTEEAEPTVLRPFVDRMMQYGVLPEPIDKAVGYSVEWTELFESDGKEASEIGKANAEALSKYAANAGVEQYVPFEGFLKHFLNMDEDTVANLVELREAYMKDAMDEEQEMDDVEEQLQEQESNNEDE